MIIWIKAEAAIEGKGKKMNFGPFFVFVLQQLCFILLLLNTIFYLHFHMFPINMETSWHESGVEGVIRAHTQRPFCPQRRFLHFSSVDSSSARSITPWPKKDLISFWQKSFNLHWNYVYSHLCTFYLFNKLFDPMVCKWMDFNAL